MARDSLAKSAPKLNYFSRLHLRLYQKVLVTGSQMACLLNHYDCHLGPSKAASHSVNEWHRLMKQLAEIIL